MNDGNRDVPNKHQAVHDASDARDRPKESKYPYGLLFTVVGAAVLLGVILQQGNNPWFGMCYAAAVVFATITVWLLSRDPDFWLIGRDGNLNPEVPEIIRDARTAAADWIEEQDQQTPLTPGRRLVAIFGVYLGGAIVSVPACAAFLPQDWPHRVLTGFGAAFCLVAIDVMVASQTTRWPTVLRGTRSFLKGTIGGAAVAGTWIVTIGLFLGASNAMRVHQERINPRPPNPQQVLANLRTLQKAKPTREYWYATVYPLLETPLTPASTLPGETLEQYLRRACTASWFHDIEASALRSEDVDGDLVAAVSRFAQERRRALRMIENVFAPYAAGREDELASEVSGGSNDRLKELAEQGDQPVDLNTTVWDLMMAEAKLSGDEDYEQALKTFADIQESLDQHAYDAYELRGRLRERYPDQRLLFPWEEDVDAPLD